MEDLFIDEDIWEMNERYHQVMIEYHNAPGKYGPRGFERIIPGDNSQPIYDWEEDYDLDL